MINLEKYKHRSFCDGQIIVINADCLDVMQEMEEVDLFLTDCPYKIIAGGVRILKFNDECNKSDHGITDPKGVLTKGRIVVSDRTSCSNKWLKKNTNSIPSTVKNGKMFENNDIQFKDWMKPVFKTLKAGCHAYIMINGRNLKDLQIEAENIGFEYQNLLVWNKGNATPNKYYMQQLEFILMLSKRPARNINNMGTKNLFNIPNNIGNKTHPCEKPINLMQILIENSTKEGDLVFDAFAGSGATALACLRSKRKVICTEIDPIYFEKMCERIEAELKQLTLF